MTVFDAVQAQHHGAIGFQGFPEFFLQLFGICHLDISHARVYAGDQSGSLSAHSM
ncbi:hypothetical protein VB145_07870 [Xanthomonas arboricola]|uniref:hypothetical protein n=1 Tax=Xanthomonas arboricola TaxID=56448 RepID=UPI001F33CB24|nr:hypothetical protein [Xanthomonas arboricola]MEA5148350.1 hypothetical protein [Xanthomonas arboricola]